MTDAEQELRVILGRFNAHTATTVSSAQVQEQTVRSLADRGLLTLSTTAGKRLAATLTEDGARAATRGASSREGIIIEVIDGHADMSVGHLPAEEHHGHRFPRDLSRSFAPASWPSRCGKVQAGIVLVRSGSAEHVPACAECEQ